MLTARKRQKLLDQPGAVLGSPRRRAGVPRRGRVAVQARRQQFEIADDRGQQIVEIMRDAAGQLADRLHFLGLPQLLFHRLALGDVARCRHDEPVALMLLGHAREHDVDRARHAGHRAARRVTLVLASADASLEQTERELRLLDPENFLDRTADHLFARQTVAALGRRVEVLVDKFSVGGGAKQAQPIRGIVIDRLDLGAAGVELPGAPVGELREILVQLAQPALAVAQRRLGRLDDLAAARAVDRDPIIAAGLPSRRASRRREGRSSGPRRPAA